MKKDSDTILPNKFKSLPGAPVPIANEMATKKIKAISLINVIDTPLNYKVCLLVMPIIDRSWWSFLPFAQEQKSLDGAVSRRRVHLSRPAIKAF